MLIQNCLFVQLLVGLNEMTKIPKLVPHWYVQGFDAKFEGCEILGYDRRDYEVEDVREEAARMHAQFGVFAETGQPWFDIAYGTGVTGLQKLKALIQSRPTEVSLARDVELDLVEAVTFDDDAGGDAQVDDGMAEALEAANAAADAAQAENNALRAKLAALESAQPAATNEKAAPATPDAAKEPSGDGGKAVDPLAGSGDAKPPKAKG